MASCVPPTSVNINYQRNGNGNAPIHNQPNGPNYFETLKKQSDASIAREMQARLQAQQNINNAIGTVMGLPPEGVDPMAGKIARTLFSMDGVKRGLAYIDKQFIDLYSTIIGSNTVAQSNVLLDLSTRLSSLFKNTQAPVEKAMLLYAGQEGRNAGANTAVSALRSVTSKAVGYMRSFNEILFAPFLKNIEGAAEKLGFQNSLEFAKAIGDYAVMRHMPEANAYWADGIQVKLTELRQKQAKALATMANVPDDRKAYWQGRADHYSAEASRLEYDLQKYLINKDAVVTRDVYDELIKCAGRTDGWAKNWIEEFHQKYNIDRAVMENYCDQLCDIVHQLNVWNIRYGNVPESNVIAMNNTGFRAYVPIKTHTDLVNHLPTDSTILNRGRFHAREGIHCETEIANAFDSIYNHAQAISMDAAARDLGNSLMLIHQHLIEQGESSPIKVLDYDEVTRLAMQGSSRPVSNYHRGLLEGKNGFVLTSVVPIVNKRTNTIEGYKRFLFTFDDKFYDEARGISGKELNEAMKGVQRESLTELASSVTGFIGGLNTHYNIAFAPINMVKDAGERINNMFGQSYRMENGEIVDGSNFIGAYVAALPKAMKFIAGVMRGTVDVNASPIGKHWQEYVSQGVKQEFDPVWHKEGMEQEILLKQLKGSKALSPVMSIIKNLDDATRGRFLNAIHKYNDYFNNISAFAQFHALREAGVSLDSTRTNTLEVINLRESGKYSHLLRALYAFAKPTLQGGASLLRSVGLSPNASGQIKPSLKGIAFGLGQMAAVAAGYNILKEMIGEEAADNISVDDLSHYLFVPIDKEGNTVKLPIPFGVSTVFAGLSVGLDRMLRDKEHPMDFIGDTIRLAFKAVSPLEFPGYAMSDGVLSYTLGMFTPSALQPAFQVVANKTHYGQSITYINNDTMPSYMQGRATTPTGWATFARLVNHYSGGMIDAAPEQVRTLVEGYFGGLTKFIPDLINRESLASMGFDESTQGILGTAMSALGMAMAYKKIPTTHTSEFYRVYNDLKKEIKSYGIRLPETGTYNTPADRESNWRDKLEEAGMSSDRIDKFFALFRADQKKKQVTKKFKEVTTLNPDFPDMSKEEMKKLFEDYVEECDQLYAEALSL